MQGRSASPWEPGTAHRSILFKFKDTEIGQVLITKHLLVTFPKSTSLLSL